jgi:phosphoribosylanthranilate isomerase
VLHVEDDTVVAQARRLGPEEVDAILLDSGRPSLAIKELGGTGTTMT